MISPAQGVSLPGRSYLRARSIARGDGRALFTQALQSASLQGSYQSIELGSDFGRNGCTGIDAGNRGAVCHQSQKSLLGMNFLLRRKGIEQAEQGRAISKSYRQSGSFHFLPLVSMWIAKLFFSLRFVTPRDSAVFVRAR